MGAMRNPPVEMPTVLMAMTRPRILTNHLARIAAPRSCQFMVVATMPNTMPKAM